MLTSFNAISNTKIVSFQDESHELLMYLQILLVINTHWYLSSYVGIKETVPMQIETRLSHR